MSRENEQTIEVYEKFGARYFVRNEKDQFDGKSYHERHIRQPKEYLNGLPKDA